MPIAGSGTRELAVDVGAVADPGARLAPGQPLEVQVLTGGDDVPGVVARYDGELGRLIRVDVEIPATSSWVFVRVADPLRANDTPGPPAHPANARGIAYCSPWWFDD